MTLLYVLWSIIPVAIAVLFSFNSGRSRSTWQGFSTRWYVGDPAAAESVLYDPSLRFALNQSLKLAILTMLVATPIGVALALGLARWRGTGRESLQSPDADPAGHSRDRDGRGPVPGLRRGVRLRSVRDLDPVPGACHVLDLVRGDHRPGASVCDRKGLRGGRHGPRRFTIRSDAPRAAPASRSGASGQPCHRVRDLDRRLRHQPVPDRRGGDA